MNKHRLALLFVVVVLVLGSLACSGDWDGLDRTEMRATSTPLPPEPPTPTPRPTAVNGGQEYDPEEW